MCRCGIDSRVSRPICRKCHGCEACGCICQAVQDRVRTSRELQRAVPCPTCKVSPGKQCYGLDQVHRARFDRAVIVERRRSLEKKGAGK